MSEEYNEQAVQELLRIVQGLHRRYPKKRFTLDGRLVGDIGEVLVEHAYDLTLNERPSKHHDAKSADDGNVQIKATMQQALTFPANHVPDSYVGVRISESGELDGIDNGPAAKIAEYLSASSCRRNPSVWIG